MEKSANRKLVSLQNGLGSGLGDSFFSPRQRPNKKVFLRKRSSEKQAEVDHQFVAEVPITVRTRV